MVMKLPALLQVGLVTVCAALAVGSAPLTHGANAAAAGCSMAAFGKSTTQRFTEQIVAPGPGDYDAQEVGAKRKGNGGAVALAYSSKKDVLEPVRKAETNSCYSDGMSENSFAFSDADSAKHSQQPRKSVATSRMAGLQLAEKAKQIAFCEKQRLLAEQQLIAVKAERDAALLKLKQGKQAHADYDAAISDHDRLQKRCSHLEQQVVQLTADLLQAQDELQLLANNIAEQNQTITQLRDVNISTDTALLQCNSEIIQLHNIVNEANSTNAVVTADNAALHNTVEQLKQQVLSSESQFNSEVQRSNELQKQLDATIAQVQQARTRESAVKRALEQTTAALDVSDSNCGRLQHHNDELVSSIESMRDELAHTSSLAHSELAQRQQDNYELNLKIQALQQAQDTLQNEYNVTIDKLHSASLQVEQLSATLKDTERDLVTSQNTSTQLQQQLDDVTQRLIDEQSLARQLRVQCSGKDALISEMAAEHDITVSVLHATNTELSHTQLLLQAAVTEQHAKDAELVALNNKLEQSHVVISELNTAKTTVCDELKAIQDAMIAVNAKNAADTVKHECVVQLYEQRISQLQTELAHQTARLSQVTEDYDASELHNDALQAEIDQLQAHCASVHSGLYDLHTLLQQATATNNDLSVQLTEANMHIDSVELEVQHMHEQAKLQDELEFCTTQGQAISGIKLYEQYATAKDEAVAAIADTQQFITVLRCEQSDRAVYSKAVSDSAFDAYSIVISEHMMVDTLRESESVLLQQQQIANAEYDAMRNTLSSTTAELNTLEVAAADLNMQLEAATAQHEVQCAELVLQRDATAAEQHNGQLHVLEAELRDVHTALQNERAVTNGRTEHAEQLAQIAEQKLHEAALLQERMMEAMSKEQAAKFEAQIASKQLRAVTDENARLAGHNNTRQKIHYLQQLKEDNIRLQRDTQYSVVTTCCCQFLASELDLARSVLIRTGLATLTTQQTLSHTSTMATRADNALKPSRATTNMANATNTIAQTGKVYV
eukprot:8502-Heterococcus_DN1.PRE.1